MNSQFEYDVALSYASEQFEYVKDVAFNLQSYGLKVFFDKFDHEQISLWGENLIDKFYEIFAKKSKYCVMFLSKNYSEKEWTLHEFDSAQIRNLKNKDHIYLLPVRFDDSEIKSLNPAVSYLNAENYSPQELAKLIYNKVKQSPCAADHIRKYNKIDAVYTELIESLDLKFSKRVFDNVMIEKNKIDNGFCYVIKDDIDVLFYLQFIVNKENVISSIVIYDSRFIPAHNQDIQTAEIILDNGKLVFLNYGLFITDNSSLTETVETITEKIIDKIHNYI